jgi:hypothetical protein
VEALEARDVPAVTATLANGILSVTGSAAADAITVRQANGQVTVAGVGRAFAAGQVSRIDVAGLGGDDVIDVRGVTKPVVLNGGTGADQFLLDPTSPARITDYTSADHVVFSNPADVHSWSIRSADSAVYVLRTGGEFRGGGSLIDTGVSGFAVAASGRVYALKSNGLLMASDVGYAPYFWTIDTGVSSFSLAPSGRVYALKSDGTFMSSTDGRPGYYSLIDRGVAEFAIASSGRVYARKTSGLLMASDVGYAPYFWTIDTGVSSFSLAPTGRVYALKASGLFMQSADGRPGYYATIDTGVTSYAIAASGRVYALKSNGLLMASDVGYAPYFWSAATYVASFTIGADGTLNIVSRLQAGSAPIWSPDRTRILGRMTVQYDPDSWASNGYNYCDVVQGASNTCTVGAALASAAAQGYNLASRIQYLGNNWYNVFLYEFGWVRTYFDGRVDPTDYQPTPHRATASDAHGNPQQVRMLDTYWPLLFNRAFTRMQAHVDWTQPQPDDSHWYRPFGTEWPGVPWHSPKNAGYALAGGDKNNWDTSEGSLALRHLLNNLQLGSVCMVSTTDTRYGGEPSWLNWLDRSIGANHIWAIINLWQDPKADGGWRIRLYNPWGSQVDLDYNDFARAFDTITMVTRAGVQY